MRKPGGWRIPTGVQLHKMMIHNSNWWGRKMKPLSLVFMTLLLSACATEPSYQMKLSAMEGLDELTLIRRWGTPEQVYESNGHRFLVYRSNSTAMLPGTEPTYQTRIVGNTAYTHGYGGYPATIVNLACSTIFEIVDGKVWGWSYRGNDCRSR